MTFDRDGCLHCCIVKEVGRRLEAGMIDGQTAVDDLVLVIAEVLAAAPPDQAQDVIGAITSALRDAESRSRQRLWEGLALRRGHVRIAGVSALDGASRLHANGKGRPTDS
jgi:hypothetical protein